MPLKGRTGNAKFPKSNTKALVVYRNKRIGNTQNQRHNARASMSKKIHTYKTIIAA